MNISICENEIEGVCLHAEKCINIFTIHNLSRIFQRIKIFFNLFLTNGLKIVKLLLSSSFFMSMKKDEIEKLTAGSGDHKFYRQTHLFGHH